MFALTLKSIEKSVGRLYQKHRVDNGIMITDNAASVCRDLGINNLSCNRRFKQEKNGLAEGIERKGKGNREKGGKKKRQSLCTGVSKLTQGDRFLQSRRFILGTGINLTFIFWQPQVATWGYSHSTPSGLCELKV